MSACLKWRHRITLNTNKCATGTNSDIPLSYPTTMDRTNANHLCDTLPAARLATGAIDQPVSATPPPAPPSPRKLCVRHERMADEGTNIKLQQVHLIFSGRSPLLISDNSLLINCHSMNVRKSMQSGPASLHRPIPVELSFSRVSSQCAASLSCLS